MVAMVIIINSLVRSLLTHVTYCLYIVGCEPSLMLLNNLLLNLHEIWYKPCSTMFERQTLFSYYSSILTIASSISYLNVLLNILKDKTLSISTTHFTHYPPYHYPHPYHYHHPPWSLGSGIESGDPSITPDKVNKLIEFDWITFPKCRSISKLHHYVQSFEMKNQLFEICQYLIIFPT